MSSPDVGLAQPPKPRAPMASADVLRVREVALGMACKVLETVPRPAIQAGAKEAQTIVAVADLFSRWMLHGEKE